MPGVLASGHRPTNKPAMNGLYRFPFSLAGSFRLLATVLAWLVLPTWTSAAPGDQDGKEVEVTPVEFKVEFLKKIPNYVTWPKSASGGTNTNVVIAILGPDPFNGTLEKLIAKSGRSGRTVVVKTGVEAQAMPECHVLFVPEAQQANWLKWRKLTETTGSEGVLTIGEHPDFLKSGGVLKLLPAKRQEFEAHLGNARRNGLLLDPRLVRIASKVH
jgi:hypothetical protein